MAAFTAYCKIYTKLSTEFDKEIICLELKTIKEYT
jgi:hypothetical protein